MSGNEKKVPNTARSKTGRESDKNKRNKVLLRGGTVQCSEICVKLYAKTKQTIKNKKPVDLNSQLK